MTGKKRTRKQAYPQTSFSEFPTVEQFDDLEPEVQAKTRKQLIAFANAYYPLPKDGYKCSFCMRAFAYKQSRNRHQTTGSCPMYKHKKNEDPTVLTDQQREDIIK